MNLPADGRRVDIRVPYGTGRCGADAATASEPGRVELRVRTRGGRNRMVRLELPHPNELLDRLLRSDCRAARVARVVSIRFGPWATARTGALRGTPLIERAGASGESGAPVTPHEFEGSVIYRITPEPPDLPRPLGLLARDRDRLSVPVLVDASRCTGHALGEVKQPFVFPVWVSIGAGEPLYSTISVSPNDQVTLRRMIDRRCRRETVSQDQSDAVVGPPGASPAGRAFSRPPRPPVQVRARPPMPGNC